MNYLVTEKHLALSLSDSSELLIDLKKIRIACPCAHCNGEKDVFGNTYKLKAASPLQENSFKILTRDDFEQTTQGKILKFPEPAERRDETYVNNEAI